MSDTTAKCTLILLLVLTIVVVALSRRISIAVSDDKIERVILLADAYTATHIISDTVPATRTLLLTDTITTVSGDGGSGYDTDGVAATSTSMHTPTSVVTDSSNSLYIADYLNFRIRTVTSSTGIINTVAGTGAAGDSNVDGILAVTARINLVSAIALDPNESNLYIVDSSSCKIRKVSLSNYTMSTVVGTGSYGSGGDGGSATSATLSYPSGIAVDSSDNLYTSDKYSNKIRFV